MDTIFALSSGSPPAAIAVVRISGPQAGDALAALAGRVPRPRRATLARLRAADGALLDQALVLWFPGPATVTGEDLAELHLHGGRAVVAAVERALAARPGLRRAQPGEFTRRAFAHGRIDLAQAEGLADLLAAETEWQRRAAMESAGGALSRRVEGWAARLLALSASVEAALDFDDEDGIAGLPASFAEDCAELALDCEAALAGPAAELLRDGFRVALAGPPNAGKSTLFNALVESEAAITAPLAGTTRDVLTRPVALGGIPFLFVDMAGLRDEAADPVEQLGIARARAAIGGADLVLWLGPEGEGPDGCWELDARCDCADRAVKHHPRLVLSAITGQGMEALRHALIDHAAKAMPRPGQTVLSARQRESVASGASALRDAAAAHDPLIVAEHLRHARLSFDRITGRAGTDDMLDALFGRFCIGK